MEKLHLERGDVLRKCKLEEIDLPLISGTLDSISLAEMKDPSASMDIDSSVSSTTSQYKEIVVDYSELDDDLKEVYLRSVIKAYAFRMLRKPLKPSSRRKFVKSALRWNVWLRI